MRFLAVTAVFLVTLTPAFSATGKGAAVSDDTIYNQVLLKLAGDSEVKGGGITIEVHDGVVTLKGKVDSEKIRAKAEKLSKKVKGVSAVKNALKVESK